MTRGRDALVAGDRDAAQEAADEVVRQITVTYIQAAIRYGAQIDAALGDGDPGKARIQQAEGWAFYRVIEPLVALADPEVAATVDGYLNLGNEPRAGAGDAIRSALESVYPALGITADEVGTLQ